MTISIDDVLAGGLAPTNHFRAEVTKRPTAGHVALAEAAPVNVSDKTREFLSRSRLDWTVSKRPLESEGRPVPSHRVIVRDDTGAQLSVVSAGWEPVQNADMAALADALVAAGATLSKGGSFDGGAGVYMLARLDATTTDVLPGDAVRVTVALRNSHEGKHSLTGSLVIGRLVCTNGLVRDSDKGRLFALRHTRFVADRLGWAKELVNTAVVEATKDLRTFKALAARQVQTAEILRYLEAVVPNPVDPQMARAKQNRERERDEILTLLESGKGTEIPGVKGTLWGAYNAVTEWVDHSAQPKLTGDRRLENTFFGKGAELKAGALKAAQAML